MDLHDKIVEHLILIGVWVGVWLEWRTLQQKTRDKIRRQVNHLLRTLRIPVSK